MYARLEAETLVLEIADWVGDDPNNPVFQAAVLLFLGINRRKHLDDLTRLSKYPRPFVRTCLTNLRQTGVWRGDEKMTYCTWDDEPLGFILDAMTATGLIERVGLDLYQPARK